MNIRMLRSDGVSTIPVLPQQKILRITLPVICSIAATLVGCGPLPNQSTLPPTVRITYCTGNPCGPSQSGNGRVDPNQPLTVFVDGFSSLSGMQSLEVDPAYSFLCSNGSVAQSGQADTIPTKTTASNQTLRLSLEVDVGTPQDHWCQNSDIPFSSWSSNFKATAVSKNGLSTTATLALQAP